MITRSNHPQKLSGSVDKHGQPKNKTLKGAKVTASAKPPAQSCDMTESAMKSSSGSVTRSRVKRVYGWHG